METYNCKSLFFCIYFVTLLQQYVGYNGERILINKVLMEDVGEENLC